MELVANTDVKLWSAQQVTDGSEAEVILHHSRCLVLSPTPKWHNLPHCYSETVIKPSRLVCRQLKAAHCKKQGDAALQLGNYKIAYERHGLLPQEVSAAHIPMSRCIAGTQMRWRWNQRPCTSFTATAQWLMAKQTASVRPSKTHKQPLDSALHGAKVIGVLAWLT